MMRNTLIGGLILVLISIYVLMSSTTPSDAHPVIILLFFLLLYIMVLIASIGLIVVASRVVAKISPRWQRHIIAYDQAYMIASLLALAPVMLVAINSVGGISLREIALIILFESIALFYLWKRR